MPTVKAPAGPPVVDLDHHVPALLAWVSNKLSRGASQQFLSVFGVGIGTWRCLMLLAVHGTITAPEVCRVVGMDKASVSRTFRSMQAQGLITLALAPDDGRLRVAQLTKKGRRLHDQLLAVALERERALLSVLRADERATLVRLLQRLHENLPHAEAATTRYVEAAFPRAAAQRRARTRIPSSAETTP